MTRECKGERRKRYGQRKKNAKQKCEKKKADRSSRWLLGEEEGATEGREKKKPGGGERMGRETQGVLDSVKFDFLPGKDTRVRQ